MFYGGYVNAWTGFTAMGYKGRGSGYVFVVVFYVCADRNEESFGAGSGYGFSRRCES